MSERQIGIGDFVVYHKRPETDNPYYWTERDGKTFLVTWVSVNEPFGTEYKLSGIDEKRYGYGPDEFYAKAARLTVVPRPEGLGA